MTNIVIAATLIAHARFILVDTRIPRDLGLYYEGVPHAYDLLNGRTPGTAAEWLHTLGMSTGWYHVFLGGLLTVLGRNQDSFQVPDLLWMGVILVAVAGLGRRLAGEVAALCAVCLTAAMPGVVVAARTAWIHVPEAAICLLGLWAWVADPGLARRRTALVLALVPMLAFSLRPSGFIWAGSMMGLVAWSAWRGRNAERVGRLKLALIVLGCALGTIPPLRYFGEYMSAKMASRARYASTLPDALLQIQMMVGALPAWISAVGLVLGIVAALRSIRRLRLGEGARPAGALLVLWVGLAGVLWLLFQAGVDNFTVAGPALALVASFGLASLLPRAGSVLSLLAVFVFWFFQWIPQPDGGSIVRRTPGLREITFDPHLMNFYRPWSHFGEPEMRALVDATCGRDAKPGECVVIADQGLYVPFGEEPGRLELFLAGETRIQLLPIRDVQDPNTQKLDALAEFHCGERDIQWRLRWPRSLPNLETLISAQKLEPAWSMEVGPQCVFLWLTPGGTVQTPEQLPRGGMEKGALPSGGPPRQEPPREERPIP